jgi:NADH-quinone oxidoreductase subunit J
MFLAFALITLGGAFALLMQRSAVQAALCMLLSFFGVAGLFLLLANPVAAAFQVIIYSGAITVLVLFVVMLLQSHVEETIARPRRVQKALSIALVLILAVGAVLLVSGSDALAAMQAATPEQGLETTLQTVGAQLFTEHIVALEAIGLLLLAAMVAAALLVKKEI